MKRVLTFSLLYIIMAFLFSVAGNLSVNSNSISECQAATWIKKTVDNGWNVGKSSSIGIDPEGSLHISHLDEVTDNLKYSTNSSGTWVNRVIDNCRRVRQYTSLAVDADSGVHIAYARGYNKYSNTLWYATNKSGSWVKEPVDIRGEVGRYNDIAVDSSGNIHISYMDRANLDLKYATNATGKWVIERVDSKGNTGQYTSIAVDSNDKVHISYYYLSNDDLKYATNQSGAWVTKTLDTYGIAGQYTNIALDSSDHVHIGYFVSAGHNDVRYITNKSGTWIKRTVDSRGDFGQYLSMTLDSSDKVHMAYRSRRPYLLKYASNSSGSWKKQIVDNRENTGLFTSIVVGSTEDVHISYWSADSNNLEYATNKIVPLPQSPPVADAGEDRVVISEDFSDTIIYGTATDPDNDSLTYRWMSEDIPLTSWELVDEDGQTVLNLSDIVPLDRGEYTLTLEVTDGEATATDQMVLSVDNSPPQAVASGGGIYQIGDPITLSGQVSDHDGDLLGYEWLIDGEREIDGQLESIMGGEPVDIPEHTLWGLYTGEYTATLIVTDEVSDPIFKELTIEIIDTVAPTLAPTANTSILWPPNHKMVDIAITTNASDNSGGTISLDVVVKSSESEEGLGDGNTAEDWEVTEIDEVDGMIYLKLLAERSGTGNERTYTVTITAMDDAGNSSSSDILFIVPHDKKKK